MPRKARFVAAKGIKVANKQDGSSSDLNFSSGNDETRVDLGEDLLEKTRTQTNAARDLRSPPTKPTAPPDLQDQFESARILMNENLVEDAKRVLRKILLADPKHIGARKKLDEIHDLELQQLFREDRPRRPFEIAEMGEMDTEKLIRDLDQELDLGISIPRHSDMALLFWDGEAIHQFAKKLDRDLETSSSRDRVDLGIGFLEMGLYELAIRQFEAASRLSADSSVEEQLQILGLIAQAMVESGKFYDALVAVQSRLKDSEISQILKLDLFYWSARAYEGLHRRDESRQWYLKVKELDPYYRDIQDRLRA